MKLYCYEVRLIQILGKPLLGYEYPVQKPNENIGKDIQE